MERNLELLKVVLMFEESTGEIEASTKRFKDSIVKKYVAEAEIGLMTYHLDINDPKSLLFSLREMIKAKYKGFVKAQLNHVYKVEMMEQMNQIPCLRGLIKYARRMEVKSLKLK
uniref:30S ribosomal protein S6 n=1 Tax=Strongyloides venezuelensis TaxID=75913 RepID=A0A0K0FGY4_STRVS